VYALSLLRTKKVPEAKKELEAALQIDPKNGDALFVNARIAIGERDFKKAEGFLDTMRSSGHDGFNVRMLLAALAEAAKDKDKQRYHFEAAYRLDPSQAEPLKGLYDLAHEDNREGDALDALRKLAALEQHDKKVWRTLLEKLVAGKQWDEARKIGEGAIFVDVTGGATHTLYARALQEAKAHDKAAYELESALLCNMKEKEKATAHALLAQSLVALGKKADAQKHKDEALKLDPDNADAKAVP
jgi:tetratricopeptide (TPR) repeat protein